MRHLSYLTTQRNRTKCIRMLCFIFLISNFCCESLRKSDVFSSSFCVLIFNLYHQICKNGTAVVLLALANILFVLMKHLMDGNVNNELFLSISYILDVMFLA